MFSALEGLGNGHQEQPQPDPGGGLCIELELIKRVPRLYCASFWCASPFIAGVLGPLWQIFRTKALFSWTLGMACGFEPPFFWVSGSTLILFPKWDRGQAENGGSTGQRTPGVRVGDGQWGTFHQAFQLGAWPRLFLPWDITRSSRSGHSPIHIESHSRVRFWDGLGPSFSTAQGMAFALSRSVSFSRTATATCG